MRDPSAAIQAAVFTALRASSAVKAVAGDPARVYDKPPAGPVYPFVRIGDDQVLDQSNSCADGWEVVVTVHLFSQHHAAPRPEVKALSDAILGALLDQDALPAPAGFEIIVAELEHTRTWMEPDGATCHGVVVVRYGVFEA